MSRPYMCLALTFIAVLVSSLHPYDTPQDTETMPATPEEHAKPSISRGKK
ncbi:hypothetical protein [Phyllobacterium leguminum]|uniref:Ti type entry exclusion protein TrbK n=1 Tax=Phyllobacterium leguminum TaxID=314237 RepID=A0A318T891_9HYPH|nr:hypothetical protein [Phyllobacterium leguminum]PYE86814.1 hypothetical protein C7477_11942 [Phyllobacterium leguminum]